MLRRLCSIAPIGPAESGRGNAEGDARSADQCHQDGQAEDDEEDRHRPHARLQRLGRRDETVEQPAEKTGDSSSECSGDTKPNDVPPTPSRSNRCRQPRGFNGRDEAIAVFGYGLDEAWGSGIVAELPAKRLDTLS